MKINLMQIAYMSEWALKKFYSALDPTTGTIPSSKFALTVSTGEEMTKELAQARVKAMASSQQAGTIAGIHLLDNMIMNGISYAPVDLRGNSIPSRYYGECDAVVIHSVNASHLHYMQRAFKHHKHILCEKPLVPVMDIQGNADRDDLDELISLEEARIHKWSSKGSFLSFMDAEHYAFKGVSLILFQNIDSMINGGLGGPEHGYGKIKKIEAYIEETQDPEDKGIRQRLSLTNRTGILTDTGVHALSFLTNLGGSITDVTKADYSIYPGYDVETSARAEYHVEGDRFAKDSTFSLDVAKFVDRYEESREQRKQIVITFENGYQTRVDFDQDMVYDSANRVYHPRGEPAHGNEYVNILSRFYRSIANKEEPHTNFTRSIKTLKALHDTLKKFPIRDNPAQRYA